MHKYANIQSSLKMTHNESKHTEDITYYMKNCILKYLSVLLVIFYRNIAITSL
jgi:hypothetical protein